MSDLQDPLQDSFEGSLQKSAYLAADKKIVFGVRKPTEDAIALSEIPLLIEAPFPNERTLHWNPAFSAQEIRDGANTAVSDDSVGSETVLTSNDSNGVGADNSSVETSPPATSPLIENAGHTAVVVTQEVLIRVNEHVSQTLERELGGFLLGNRYRCPNTQRSYVIIDQFSPAKFTQSTEVNLAFTHEAWAQLSDELSGKFLGKLVVGWYHSHPRMDVFLSSHDMEIQTERFPEPWMTALVLEPEKHRGGFFCARDGRVKPNSPVDFFELLERNSRESVVAWENYAAVDPVTNSAPVICVTNTATSPGAPAQEILAAHSKQSKRVPAKRKGRRRFVLGVVIVVLLLAALAFGVLKSQKLKRRLGLSRDHAVAQ